MVSDEERELYRLQLALGLRAPDLEFERRIEAHDEQRQRRLRFAAAGRTEHEAS